MELDNIITHLAQVQIRALPKEEQEFARILNLHLNLIHTQLASFAAALSLLDYSLAVISEFSHPEHNYHSVPPQISSYYIPGSSSLHHELMFVAFRDAAMTVYHFWRSCQIVKDMLDKLNSFRTPAKSQIVDLVCRDLRAFVKAGDIRDSVAHTSDLLKSPSEAKKNAIKKPHVSKMGYFASGHVINSAAGRTFVTTGFKGEVVTYDLTNETLETLHKYAARMYDGIKA
jgi:hypothetical protein